MPTAPFCQKPFIVTNEFTAAISTPRTRQKAGTAFCCVAPSSPPSRHRVTDASYSLMIRPREISGELGETPTPFREV